jgi:hypothetical protein
MKVKIGLILGFCFAQVLSLPVDESPAKVSESDTVAEFRAAIDYRFTRFQAFYDATGNAMRMYRLAHVDNIHVNYRGIMTEFGAAIEAIRSRGGAAPYDGKCKAEFDEKQKIAQQNSNLAINACAARANATLHNALATYFYPTFDEVQDRTSKIPLHTLNALSRGNVITDNSQIISYLASQYDSYVMQWLGSVSQLFRWEKNKVDVTGQFYVEEMNLCLNHVLEVFSKEQATIAKESLECEKSRA